jgi:hypothetical protein
MATKIQRTRRIGGIAIGTVRAIFRIGRTWGVARTRVATARRPAPTLSTGAALAAGAACGVAGAYFLDPQNGKGWRHAAPDRVRALFRNGTDPLPEPERAQAPAPTREAVAAAR